MTKHSCHLHNGICEACPPYSAYKTATASLSRIFVYCYRATGRWYLDIDGQQVPTDWTLPIGWQTVERCVKAQYPSHDVVVDILSR